MQGLELSRKFYEECGRPLLGEAVPSLVSRMAAGLVGEGSECFGFDDEISRDHDWGPAFCLWLPREDLDAERPRIEAALARLPGTYMGLDVRMAPDLRRGRVGPLAIEDFYARFLSVPRAPQTMAEWRRVPEPYLAVATNGEVFDDPLGRFSAIRATLLGFYPEDLRLKKIAARCMAAAQAGQYNLPRMLGRYDHVSADLCRARFAEALMSLVFLLNRRYMPFYKWAYRAVGRLPVLGMEAGGGLSRLMAFSLLDAGIDEVVDCVEGLCQSVADCLVTQGLSSSRDPWLYSQAPQVQEHIRDEGLRSMPLDLE